MRFRLTRTNNAGLSGQVVQVILGENTYMTMGVFGSDSQWLLPAHGDPYTRKGVPKTAELLDLGDIRKAVTEGGWIDHLSMLSEAAHIPVLADYYRAPAIVHDLKTDDGTSATFDLKILEPLALDGLCHRSGYLWWKRDRTLLLRKRDWYAQRRYEVSDRWMRDILHRLHRQQNVPTYADLCRLLDLTPAQITGMNSALASAGNGQGGEPSMENLDTQEGLHEMLTMVQGTAEASDPLPQGEPAKSAKRAQSLRGWPSFLPAGRSYRRFPAHDAAVHHARHNTQLLGLDLLLPTGDAQSGTVSASAERTDTCDLENRRGQRTDTDAQRDGPALDALAAAAYSR